MLAVISAFSYACVAARLVHAPRSSTGDVVVSEMVRLNAAGSALDDLGVAMANLQRRQTVSGRLRHRTSKTIQILDVREVHTHVAIIEMQQSADDTRFLVSNS